MIPPEESTIFCRIGKLRWHDQLNSACSCLLQGVRHDVGTVSDELTECGTIRIGLRISARRTFRVTDDDYLLDNVSDDFSLGSK